MVIRMTDRYILIYNLITVFYALVNSNLNKLSSLPCGEGVIAGYFGEVASVVEG